MQELEEYFKDKCDKFVIFTGEKSERALRLYTKLGYHITANENVGKYSLIHMEKYNTSGNSPFFAVLNIFLSKEE